MIGLSIVLIGILFTAFFYNYQISAMSNDSEEVVVEIKSGSVASIGKTLYENGLIHSELIFKIYVKLNSVDSLKASTYKLNKNMNLKEIINILEEGNSYNPDQVVITFKEGLNVRKIAKLVEEETINSKIYYPLEGYLFPNTYAFLNKDVTSKEIIEKMLDEMDKQLTKYKSQIDNSDYSLHELMTLASIVELEGANADDRAAVAGVFYNRLKDGWVLGSDVTTYYYLKIDDFKQSLNGNRNLFTCDYAYNTRCTSFVGLPIGPISNPGNESIAAVMNYKKHNYYYFVADCKGKTYLSKDATEHYNTINRLKNDNNWCA